MTNNVDPDHTPISIVSALGSVCLLWSENRENMVLIALVSEMHTGMQTLIKYEPIQK